MLDYIFPILRYHSRWSDLSGEDVEYMFHKDKVSHNGYYMRVDVRPVDGFPEPEKLSDYTLGDKAMEYLEIVGLEEALETRLPISKVRSVRRYLPLEESFRA